MLNAEELGTLLYELVECKNCPLVNVCDGYCVEAWKWFFETKIEPKEVPVFAELYQEDEEENTKDAEKGIVTEGFLCEIIDFLNSHFDKANTDGEKNLVRDTLRFINNSIEQEEEPHMSKDDCVAEEVDLTLGKEFLTEILDFLEAHNKKASTDGEEMLMCKIVSCIKDQIEYMD